MFTLTVRNNFPEVARAIERLGADIEKRALTSAINKTMDQARTRMTREIVASYNVSAGYVRERLRIRRASAMGMRFEAALIGGDGRRRAANIIAFVEKSVTLAQARKRAKDGTLRQLFVKVKRGGGARAVAGAFIGNKGRTVFQRTGKGRLPIRPVQTIDVPQMFNARHINRVVVELIRDKFPEIFAREARYFTERFSRG